MDVEAVVGLTIEVQVDLDATQTAVEDSTTVKEVLEAAAGEVQGVLDPAVTDMATDHHQDQEALTVEITSVVAAVVTITVQVVQEDPTTVQEVHQAVDSKLFPCS